MAEDDPFDLSRFVTAQDPVFETVLGELRAGRKQTHWMWFVFPQLRALGRSSTATFFGIRSIDEARAISAIPCLRNDWRGRSMPCSAYPAVRPTRYSAHPTI